MEQETLRTTVTGEEAYIPSSRSVEITVQIREDQILALEAILVAEWQSKNACDPSLLVQEALDLLINSRIKTIRLSDKHYAKETLSKARRTGS